MSVILLTLILGNWSLVGNDGWQLIEPAAPIVKPEPPPDPIPPPKVELQGGDCASGNCGVPRRGFWRRRR